MTTPRPSEHIVSGVLPDGSSGEEWLNARGKRHRENGPAFVHRDSTGVTITEAYYLDGQISRHNGPAKLSYRAYTGKLHGEEWFVGGMAHRLDGPAGIDYREDGSVRVWEWWVLDTKYRSRADALLALSVCEDETMSLALHLSPYGVLLDEGHDAQTIVRTLRVDEARTVEGIRALLAGTPPEWVRAFEESEVDRSLDGLPSLNGGMVPGGKSLRHATSTRITITKRVP